MMRVLNILVIAALVSAAAYVYKIKFESTRQAERLARFRMEIRQEQDAIAVLRAEWSKLVEEYEKKSPCYHFRHLVKPGITGWAQINYPYGEGIEDTLRKLEYDLYYIRYFSFVLDASIVLKTIHVMLFGKGR